jgi:hypothetical protein
LIPAPASEYVTLCLTEEFVHQVVVGTTAKVGFVVSTFTILLQVVGAGLFDVSNTLLDGNVNITSQFDQAFHVYVNVNVLFVALHHTTALPNIT